MQSQLLNETIEKFPLTLQEQQIIKRGRNAASSGRKTFPKRLTSSPSTIHSSTVSTNDNVTSSNKIDTISGVGIYQEATAFEALLGYFYLTNMSRCNQFLLFIEQELNMQESKQ